MIGKSCLTFRMSINYPKVRLIIPRPHSKSVTVNPIISIAPVLPSDLVAPDFVRKIGSIDIYIGKLFDSKYNLILKLRKVS